MPNSAPSAHCFRKRTAASAGAPFDVTVLFEELGAGLVNEPFLATAILGGGLIAELGNAEQKAVIEEVIAGTKQLAFAHGEPKSRYDASHVETTAKKSGDGYVLNGAKAVVLNGGAGTCSSFRPAPLVRPGMKTASRSSSFSDTPGVSRLSYPSIDGLHAAEIRLENVSVGADALLAQKARPGRRLKRSSRGPIWRSLRKPSARWKSPAT